MKKVFATATGFEAHMMRNLLEQNDIFARVDGELLQGGIGGIQAMNIVRVMVDETDYARAKEVITQWEAQQKSK
ncbi:MAG: DUF2007 domain-containing protein [Proteobacteria bacterium]|nr:DUF2007 domain-containing protein [Pseudomonadota bacterium]